MKPSHHPPTVRIQDLLPEILIHQDVCEYALGAVRKVRKVVDEACIVTAPTYTKFSDYNFNQTAMDELNGNSEKFSFEYFA